MRTSPPGAGLVLTSDNLTMARVAEAGAGIRVLAWGAVPLAPGIFSGGGVQDPGRLGEAIASLRQSLRLRERALSVALPAESCSLHALSLPEVPENEKRAIVRGELMQTGALPDGAGAFDFLWVGAPSSRDGPAHAEVYAFTLCERVLQGIHTALRSAGLRLARVEPASYAAARAYLAGTQPREIVALLHCAERQSDLCILEGLHVRHWRRIPAGSAECRLDGGEWDARDAGGIPEAPDALSRSPRYDPPGGFLGTEVARTLAFHARRHVDEAQPAALTVLGPHTSVRPCEQALARRLPVPVRTADARRLFEPPAGAAPGDWQDAADLLAAAGCAIAAARASVGMPPLDLSRDGLPGEGSTRKRGRALARVGWIASALLAAAALSFRLLEGRILEERRALAVENSRLRSGIEPLERERRRVEAVERLRRRSETPVAAVLGRVAAAAGRDIMLTSLQIGPDGTVRLDGQAPDVAAVRQFAAALGEGSAIRTPMVESFRQERNRLAFRITGTGREPAPAPGEDH